MGHRPHGSFVEEKTERKRAHGGCLWLSEAKKDVTSCEKPGRVANTLRPPDIRMGQPVGSDPDTVRYARGEPGELKHLSTRRKRK